MADIRAFRATRYDLGRTGALAEVIAPPYDVIDQALSDKLHAQSPYNVIRLMACCIVHVVCNGGRARTPCR